MNITFGSMRLEKSEKVNIAFLLIMVWMTKTNVCTLSILSDETYTAYDHTQL